MKRSCTAYVPTQAPGLNEIRGQNVLRTQLVRCLIWNRRFSCRLPSSSVILSHIQFPPSPSCMKTVVHN